MNGLPGKEVYEPGPPRIVELVGPAGAGKTTLSRFLSQCDKKIQTAPEIELRKIEHIPIFLADIPFLLSIFLRRSRSSRWFTWEELKYIVYLRRWPRLLRHQATDNDTVLLLDHGPVFKLATLNEFGPEKINCQSVKDWWGDVLDQWARTLDMIIWLDAPDSVLMERINHREQRHDVKAKSEQEVFQFLTRYRCSYEQVLAKLTANGRPILLRFDTNQVSIEQITDRLLVTCGLNHHER